MKSLLISLFITNICFATFPLIDVQNLEGEYLEGAGRAHADKAYYVLPVAKIRHENIDLTFSKKDKSLVIQDPSTSVELDVDLSFLNVLQAFTFKNLNIKSTSKLFTITSSNLDVYVEPKKYEIEDFLIETDVRNIPTSDDDDITILDGIILKGRLLADKLNFGDYDDIVFDYMLAENPDFKQELKLLSQALTNKAIAIPMIIRHLNFEADKGKLYGKALVDSYINLWFRVWGDIKSNEETNQVIIHLSKAKLGIFSVTETVLKSVKNMKLDKVSVDVKKRTITIDF